MKLIKATRLLLPCLTLMAATAAAQAQNFPTRPVTVVVPFSAGGATDIVARLVGKEAAAHLGQPLVIENRPGASGAIGANVVARSAPDGYTVCLCGGGPMVILKLTDPKQLPYDPDRDLTPVTLSHTIDYVMGVAADSPYKSMQDLVADAKAKPGELSYASVGPNSPNHLGHEYFNQMAGVKVNHIPYKGENDLIGDLTTGRVTMGALSAQFGEQMANSGKVRLLGAWSSQRLAKMPSLPTVAEQGWPEFEAGTFVTVAVPSGTPSGVVDRLNSAFVAALNHPTVNAKMVEMGFTPVANSPKEAAEFLTREREKWGKVISSLGLASTN